MTSNNKKFIPILLEALFLLTIALLNINFTGGGAPQVSLEPTFTELKEDEPSFSAIIEDDNTKTEVTDISFTGHTSLGGIRKEKDDSVNKLELSNIKELEIINPDHRSKKYSDKDVMLAKVITNDGTEIDDLLIPRNVTICGIEQNTKIKKAWFLRKVKRITIEKEIRKIKGKEEMKEEKEEKGILSKIASGIKTISEKIAP